MNKEVEVYNSFRPVIPLWEKLYESYPEEFEFIELRSKYRQHINKKSLPGQKFETHNIKDNKIKGVLYFLKACWYVLRNKKDLRVTFTQPPLFFVYLYFIKKVRGDRYILHVMDVYPDIFYEVYPKTKLLKPILNKFVQKSLKGADKIIVIGRCMERLIANKGIRRDKIKYFPNFSGVDRKNYLKNNDSTSFQIVYAGNIGLSHDLSTLITVAKKLSNTNLEVIIIGKGINYKKTKDLAKEKNVKNVFFLSGIEDEKFTKILINADMHFINLKESFNGLVVPSKYYTALKLGVPVLYEGPKDSEIFRQLQKNKIGCGIKNGDSIKMESTIKKLIKGDIQFKRENIQNHYNEYYQIENRLNRYYNIIRNNY